MPSFKEEKIIKICDVKYIEAGYFDLKHFKYSYTFPV